MKFLVDEDLSPSIARYLCEQMLVDDVAVRDRNLLNTPDYEILEYAFQEERIITANVRDFERFANIREVHAGIVLICDGTLLRTEQMEVVNVAVVAILAELEAGTDMINRVLYVEADRSLKFENLPI
ncbi:MAG: DUF5615 family PIN-like protein [Rivularia sp. (in: cyanobacteria)]